MNEEKYESLVINLKVIAQLPRNRRLRTTSKGYFTIEDNHLLVPIRRKIYGEGRDRLKCDIKSLIIDAQTQTKGLLKRYLEFSSSKPSLEESDEKRTVMEQLGTIHRELKRSITGFENLMSTYDSDALMVGMLEHVVETIRSVMNEITQVLPDVEENISPVLIESK